jgi:hypothetical protein
MVLKLAPTHIFVVAHSILHCLQGLPAVLEAYKYATGRSESLGIFPTVMLVGTAVEVILCYKYRQGYFENPTPPMVIFVVVTMLLGSLVVFPVVWFGMIKPSMTRTSFLTETIG